MPKTLRKASLKIMMVPSKPVAYMSWNLEKPAESKFISMAKKINVGIKPYQKRFSLVAIKIPFAAKTKSSHHFLQFIPLIITHFAVFMHNNYVYLSSIVRT